MQQNNVRLKLFDLRNNYSRKIVLPGGVINPDKLRRNNLSTTIFKAEDDISVDPGHSPPTGVIHKPAARPASVRIKRKLQTLFHGPVDLNT